MQQPLLFAPKGKTMPVQLVPRRTSGVLAEVRVSSRALSFTMERRPALHPAGGHGVPLRGVDVHTGYRNNTCVGDEVCCMQERCSIRNA